MMTYASDHPSSQVRGSITASLFQKTMLTMLVSELSGAVTAIIDAVLVGRYLGAASLAAAGLGTPYYSVASIVSGALMVGSINLCTNAVGKGDMKRLNGIFSLTLSLGILASVLLSLCGVLFAPHIATLFGAGGASAEVFRETSGYLRGLFIGAPGFILFVILSPLLQLDGDMRLPKLASLVVGIVDVTGDLLNVFVFHGGMFGMALASSISHYSALAVVLCHFLKKGSMFRFSVRDIPLKTLGPLLKDGMPRVLSMIGRGLLPIVLNALVLRLNGDAGVTAYASQISISFVVGALGWGIGGAVLMMGGMMVGEQNISGMKTVVRTAMADILTGVVGLALLVALLSPRIAALFIPAAGEARTLAVSAIRCYAVCLPFLAMNVSAANYLQTVSHTGESNFVNIGIELLFPAAAAYLLSSFLGIRGVWLAFPIGQALLTLIIFVRLFLGRDSSRKGLAAWLLLPPDFGVPDSDCIERSVRSMDEVIGLSAEVVAFCAAHGIGSRQANRMALCVEELAGNVIEHGFSDGKPHRMDLRILTKDGRLILRLRDDCELFDLKEKAENWAADPEHPERNIGIRLIMNAAESIVYSSAMNTNNLIVTV